MSVQVGVIGAGLMGSTHVRTLTAAVPDAEVAAVSDAVRDSADRIAQEAGVETVYTDALELIHDPRVEAVVIASPADTHEQFVLACIEAGKPVLCEKPLAATPEAARHVLDAEVALGRRLIQVGFMRRFDPGYVELRARLRRQEIGTPVLVYSTHRNATVPPGFATEMIIKDTVVHDVDTVRWLLGQELVKATALRTRSTSLAPPGVRDPQVVTFETDSGTLVNVEAFVNAQYGYDIGCEIVGESGTLALPRPEPVPMGFQERFASAYARELDAWVASIAAGEPAGANAWDGYAASAVCEAAWQAVRSGQPTEVRLDAKPDLYDSSRPLLATNSYPAKD
jgi:myo-inositol 2-dehydrogenase / D-chiro-inositol 1-dehydrogenase